MNVILIRSRSNFSFNCIEKRGRAFDGSTNVCTLTTFDVTLTMFIDMIFNYDYAA